MDFIHAAAIPEAYITAHDAVVTQAKLKKGESLLIHAVGSSVGLAALQIASALGAQVLGTSRTADKLERCSGMGLHRGVVVSSPPQFASSVLHETQGLGVSVILDLVGAKYFAENMASLGSKGRLLLVGLQSGSRTEFDMGVALEKRATIIGTVLRGRSVEEKAAATKLFSKAILPFLEAGEIRPTIDRIFPAEKVREAYIYLQSNSSFGKVVLEF
jgi:NADPH:quinone reductase-like Zn-dependent oxidoreductase